MKTEITNLLGCSYPIIQTAMGWVSDAKLTAATCNAGGFGFLAGATIPPNEMEEEILKTKTLTSKPFGVNFHMYQPNASHIVELVVKHQVKAVSYSRSPDPNFIRQLKNHGILCIPTIGLPKHARKAIEFGADALTVQGGEGGGHTGAIPTSLLLPAVVDATKGQVPVIGAGGFKDGRGLVAALAYGAQGIAMGTRFLLTKESPVPLSTKQRYLECHDPGSVIVSKALDGMPQRMILNEMLTNLEKASPLKRLAIAIANGFKYRQFTGATIGKLLSSMMSMIKAEGLQASQAIMSANAPMIIQKSMVEGHPTEGALPSGQVAGVIEDLVSCDDLIRSIMGEAYKQLEQLQTVKGTTYMRPKGASYEPTLSH